MGDKILAGYETVGTYEPIQLYAGEKQPVSTQGTAKSGYKFGQLNVRNETYRFPIVAEVAGKLVPWNPAGNDNPDDYATGTLTLANAVPVDGDKVTINGVDVLYKAAPVAGQKHAAIGATINESAANMAAAINAHRNEFGVDGGVTATAAGAVVTIRSPGLAGNAVTLAKTFATGANGAVSGANLAGGTDADAAAGGAGQPIGILPHALDTTATGYNADVDTPIFLEGVFNYEALDVPAGTTYAELRTLFRGTGIVIQKLY